MDKISTMPVVPVSPTSIDDDGSKLIKSMRNSGTDTAVTVNKLISLAKKIDARLVTVEEETISINDLTDVTLNSPVNLQMLQYDDGAAQWKNAAIPPKTVSFCFVYPVTNQYSPFYKFKSNKKIIGIDISAIYPPSAPMIFRLYRSDGWERFGTYFSGQNSHWDVNLDVSAEEMYCVRIEGAANGINLANFELTVVDR